MGIFQRRKGKKQPRRFTSSRLRKFSRKETFQKTMKNKGKIKTRRLQGLRTYEQKRKNTSKVPEGTILPKTGDPILTIDEEWLQNILCVTKSIAKRMEVRRKSCRKPDGTIIVLWVRKWLWKD